MSPSYSDFSQITELMDIKRLYEEQEEKYKLKLHEKDEEIEGLRHDLDFRNQLLEEKSATFADKDDEIARLRADAERLRSDAQSKINQLQERIKELNQKLLAAQQGKR
jgi:predicted nuclease with TOPRIM domain